MLALTVVGAAAVLDFIGADARWLSALGSVIAANGGVPHGVPFASAPTAHWPNALVLAELVFHGLQALGGARGLMLAQLAAIALAVGVLTRDAIDRGAPPQATAAATLVAMLGATATLAVTRAQLFSLPLFAVVVALLRSDQRAQTWRIWLVVPLLAVWANLHGAVLVGLGVTGLYLVLTRLRGQPALSVALGVACLGAVCLTPAGVRTPLYYYGVLTNEAAQQGQGMWAPLSLTAPLDLLFIVCTLGLALRLRPRWLAPWECAALVALGLMTLNASRSGIWLLMFLVGPAAHSFTPRRRWDRLLPVLATAGLLGLIVGVARGPLPMGASAHIVANAVTLAHGTPILAEDLLAEQAVLAGGRVWVSNPIDAFSRRDQDVYLEWAAGRTAGLRALTPEIRVVLTRRDSPAQRLMARQPDVVPVASDARTVLYERFSRTSTSRPTPGT